MKGSQRSNRPYVRSNSPLASRAGDKASRLASSAGLARPTLEALEPRQMLFSLTITPESGGTVTTQFGYVIPYLIYQDDIDDFELDDPIIEDFNDENGDGGAGVGPIPSGTAFLGSLMRVNHSIQQPANMRLRAPDPNEPNELEMFVRPGMGEQFSFRFQGDATGQNFLGVVDFTIDVRAGDNSNVGLPIFDDEGNEIMTVELRLLGETIATFSGQSLALLDTSGNPQPGLGTFQFQPPFGADSPTFDEIIFSFQSSPNDPFILDNAQFTVADDRYAPVVDSRVFGAEVVFSGPVGATVQFLDLYGRDMANTLALGIPPQLNVPIVDVDGDGVANFNDGIGRIIFSDTDETTNFSLVGGTVTFDTNLNAWVFNDLGGLNGQFEAFEAAGFGFYGVFDGMNWEVGGMPAGTGSVIVGSPFVRDNSTAANYNVEGFAPGGQIQNDPASFTRADQGVKVLDGANIGTVNIHGALFGSSDFTGFVNNFWTGYLLGSVSVQGDIGTFISASDAGMWAPDADLPLGGLEAVVITGSELVVNRTAGDIFVAGRSVLNVTVGGNINNPDDFPPRDVLRIRELEVTETTTFDTPTEDVIAAYTGGGLAHFTPSIGGSTYRNDQILSAQFVSSAATAVEITGVLGDGGPINTAEDAADVFAFVVDGTQPVLIESQGGLPIYMRIMDQDGRTLAANQLTDENLEDFQRVEFMPDTPGVYYLVVTGGVGFAVDGNGATTIPYLTTITGMAPVSLGSYRTGASSGAATASEDVNAVNVLSGAVGSIRVGTAWAGSTGGEVSPATIINVPEDTEVDTLLDFVGGTFSLAGDLYNITTGSDMGGAALLEPINMFIGGNLGTVITGLSNLVGTGPFEGDLGSINLIVDGSIAMLDIRGGVGIDQDVDDPINEFIVLDLDSVNISLGNDADGPVSLGWFRIGSRVGGDSFGSTLNVTTPAGATIGGFLVDQDTGIIATDPDAGIIGRAPSFITGAGSDVRFVDFNQIDEIQQDQVTPLVLGAPVQFTDDGGGLVQIAIGGGDGNTNSFVRVLPIDESEGVAIGQIVVDLTGGGTLQITGLGSPDSGDVISIGRIIVIGASGAASIVIDGAAEIDVWQIQQVAGAPLQAIENRTGGGDLVAVDVIGLTNLNIIDGDLGRTQTPSWGPRLIGPFLGIGGGGGGVGGLLPLNGELDPNYNGTLYRPINDVNRDPGNAYLDDIGGAIDPYLNGLVVRTGDLTAVAVSGQTGDVIVAGGNLLSLVANSDNMSAIGEFHGIVGNIYANTIQNLVVGDGMIAPNQAPLLTTSIFANTDILSITNGANEGAIISGVIIAGAGDAALNPIGLDLDPDVTGLGAITLTNGDFIDAYIGSQTLDAFWQSVFYPRDLEDDRSAKGDIATLQTNNGDFFRSTLVVAALPNFQLTGGFFDASTIIAEDNVNLIEATGFRNSTLTGGDLEFRFNRIEVAENLTTLRTTSSVNPLDPDPVGVGDMIDLRVDVLGSIIGSITANNFTRVDLDVDDRIEFMNANNNIRGSSITAGRLQLVTAGENIRTSTFNISGPIINLNAADNITNTRIAVTGPDGRIELIETAGLLSGEISASGPITTLRSTAGDISATIITTTSKGDVDLLEAARDLNIETDISGTLNMLTAGRHIGNQSNPSVILVRDDVANVEAGGQLYSDIRIGGSLTGAVTLGPVSSKPNNDRVGGGDIVAYERINLVEVTGDFGGSVISYSDGIGTVRIIDGSFRQSGLIASYDGSINLVEVLRGHLQGDIHADVDIGTIRVTASANGVFGDIGINPNLSTGVAFDSLRNELPPGAIPDATIQGPSITAGEKINRIIVGNGSVYEAFIFAGTRLGPVNVNGDVSNDNQTIGFGTVFAAGNKIANITITGDASDAMFLAGVTYFGADGRPGGVGVNEDLVKRGFIQHIVINGDGSDLIFSSGMEAGPDGVYNTNDDFVSFGKSRTNRIRIDGSISNATAYSDSFFNSGNNVSAGITRAGTSRPVDDNQIAPGIPAGAVLITPGSTFNFSYAGGSGTITFNHPNAAPKTGLYWDSSTGTLTLIKTHRDAEIIINSGGSLNNFDIVSNDDASVGTLTINANLTGDSDIIIDNKIFNLNLQNVSGTGTIRAGGNIQTITMGAFLGGELISHYTRDLTINGDFGSVSQAGEVDVSLISVENVLVTGGFYGDFNVQRYNGLFQEGSFQVNGLMRRGLVNIAQGAGVFNIGEMVESRITVGDDIVAVSIDGDMFDAAIIAGADLGLDTRFGGSGLDADTTSTGNIGDVDIAGDFIESDLVAGMLRGPDGYFGTGDDSIGEGRSTIGMVTIGGAAGGSNLGSESFRISATGAIDGVMVDGDDYTGSGNLVVDTLDTQPLPIQVVDIRVTQESFVFTAEIAFNQNMNGSTIGQALTVSEVRGNGQVTITLDEGADYIVEYDQDDFVARVIFSQNVTTRDLPQVGDEPGPGVYRFTFDQDILRAQLVNARLDGDGNGFAEAGDDFSADDIVGDAGDKLVAETVIATDENDDEVSIDFYGATDLDAVMDGNFIFDGLPDANKVFTLRGFIGDHPDSDLDVFSFSSDVDLYKITLQAGQILRLGQMTGGAQFAARAILDDQGNALMATTRTNFSVLDFFGDAAPFDDLTVAQNASTTLVQRGTVTPEMVRLPNNPLVGDDLTTEDVFLIRETGTYYLTVTNTDQFEPGNVPNITTVPGGTGSYAFDIEVFDDGDSGFTATTDAGNGARIVNAPNPFSFAGPDGVFGTDDDASTIKLGSFTFSLDTGADGVLGTADDIVSGGNGSGITSTLSGSTMTSVISSAIGEANAAGVPNNVYADVDVFHLNGGGLINPGTQMRITVRLTELGADLGSRTQDSLLDFSGNVQFALFDTTNAVQGAIDDANLVFSPSDFSPTGQSPGVIADDGSTSYGYDDQGDFFVEFAAPGQIGADGLEAASYAIYLQGAFNTDYQIEVVTDGVGQVVQSTQNVLLELNGGTIDWLEAGGLTTALGAYSTSVVGFTGKIDFQPIDDVIIEELIDNLQAMFAAAGVDVNISTNPADFEFEDFSTVFLTRSNDPINFFSSQFYGVSEHVDVLNADRNDEAVIFVPTMSTLGLAPGDSGVQQFADSLTAAVGRRVGELLGLRTETGTGGGATVNVQASNSVEVFGDDLEYRFSTLDNALSNGYDSLTDTIFFMGQQNADSLLDRILSD